ncbi:MAG TPA: adenylate/guanylate cyclase domain-containing protein, partial [Candidatus Acidoferrum sp.]|nr:adenylate/guanylate cyclase domain-containing protein [Candidatus Acidoferrum sp.]
MAPAAAVAERRLVSILFADLVGFTTLAEGRDAEDTRELLSAYFELARDIVGRYGGTVEKFIGDAVMAVWGAPTAHEDDAERAVRAALDLVDAVRTLGPTIQARAGVLTGEAAVTIGATDQGMVAGDLVNTASRLQSVAAPGTVLVGEATQRAASRAIAFEEAGEQSLKGKTAPVPAWRALRVVAEVGGRNRSETLEAPFVGRDDELRQLKDLFHATARDRRARLVSVIGPAGIGKSRLAWEFLKYIDGLADTVWWHDGRSPAYGDGISFWALGEMVRERCQLLETDDEATTRAKVAEALVKYVPDADERTWIEPALLALLGIGVGTSSEQLFGAWRTFFERLAASAPVVMVFEDFHFADSGLIDFVDHLLEWSRNDQIYVLTLSRPELLERRADWGAGKRNFTSLYLEPLQPTAMRELLAGLVPGLPKPAVATIVARADGMPLYAVETVRMLLAEGKVALEGDRYVPVGDLANLAVPETLTALIASRLDGLGADDRVLVSDAAVLGQSFTLAGLAAVSGLDHAALEPRLRGLVRRELLTLEADPRSPERGQYAFVQALIREVAYNTLAKRDRKMRHLAAARFFETLGSDELAGALAGHYLAAHQNAGEGAEADALAAQARVTLKAAAERAISLGSLAQAVVFLDQARAVTRDESEIADLLERAGWAAGLAGLTDTAEDRLRQAVEIRRSLGDPDAIARAIAALASLLISALKRQAGLAMLEPAAAELVGTDGTQIGPGGVALLAQLARAYSFGEQPRRAVEVADRALEAGERLDLAEIVSDLLITRGLALSKLGRKYESVGAISAGIALADERGLISTSLRGRLNLGVMAPNVRVAYETAEAAIEIARRYGMRGLLRILIGNSASAALDIGEWDHAVQQVTAAREEAIDELEANYHAWTLFNFTAWRGADLAAELAHLTAWAERYDDPATLDGLLELRAQLAFRDGDLQTACDEWIAYGEADTLNAGIAYFHAGIAALMAADRDRAMKAIAGLDGSSGRDRMRAIDGSVLRAGLAALEGLRADVLHDVRPLLAEYARQSLVWHQSMAGLMLSTLATGDEPEAREIADGTREILTRLKAQPFIDQLDAALARRPAGS